MILLSVIIPLYNVQKYIERCLESLINLKIENEILIIDDESEDDSINIVKDFKNRHADKNIKIISQKNKGLSGARNTGIWESKGEYVSFIDSDDFVDLEKYEEFVRKAIKSKVDIAIGNAYYYYDKLNIKDKEFFRNRNLNKYGISSGVEWLNILNRENSYRAEVWDDLYRREFLIENNLFFMEGLLHEDEMFTVEAMLKAKKVNYIGIPFYYYVQRENSIMSNKKIKNYIDLTTIIEKLETFSKEKKNKKAQKFFLEKIHNLYKTVFEGFYYLDKKRFIKIKKEYRLLYLKKLLFSKIQLRYKVEGIIIIISYNLFKKVKTIIQLKK